MSIERWLPVVDFEGLYEVSDYGRVRSLDRVAKHAKRGPSKRKGKMLSLIKHSSGYFRVFLCCDGGRNKQFVHRIVLEAFVGLCPPGRECRHLDGNPGNNHLSNLAWGTAVENAADQKMHGTAAIGRHKAAEKRRAIKTADKVWAVREMYESGVTQWSLAKHFGVTPAVVCNIIHGRCGYDRLAIFGPLTMEQAA